MNQYSPTNYASDHEAVSDKLAKLGVPSDLIEPALGSLPEQTRSILIYGSRARGDHLIHSDLDLLAIVPRPTYSRRHGDANVTCYTAEQLQHATKTLFGMHIQRDGIVIADTDGELHDILQSLEAPNPSTLIRRVRHFSSILDSAKTDKEQHLAGLCRLARFLLRTAIYTQALDEGSPCFSVRELAERLAEPALATLLASNPTVVGEATANQLHGLCTRLRIAVGSSPATPYSSLMALVVGEWDSDRECASLALLAMTDDHIELDYSQLANVFL